MGKGGGEQGWKRKRGHQGDEGKTCVDGSGGGFPQNAHIVTREGKRGRETHTDRHTRVESKEKRSLYIHEGKQVIERETTES